MVQINFSIVIKNIYNKKPMEHYSGVDQHPFLDVLRWEIGADKLEYAGDDESHGLGMVTIINLWGIYGKRMNKKKEKIEKKDLLDGEEDQGEKKGIKDYLNINHEEEMVYGIKPEGKHGTPDTNYIINRKGKLMFYKGEILHNIWIVKDHYAADIILNKLIKIKRNNGANNSHSEGIISDEISQINKI
eukprot:41415_1